MLGFMGSQVQFLLHVVIQFSQHHLLKRLSFHCCVFFAPLSKIVDIIYVDLCLGSLASSIDLCVCFYASATLF